MTDDEAVELFREAMEYWGRNAPLPKELQVALEQVSEVQRVRVSMRICSEDEEIAFVNDNDFASRTETMAKVAETPGQKLDREIAEEKRREKMCSNLISSLTQEELKTMYSLVHIKLYGDGEDD